MTQAIFNQPVEVIEEKATWTKVKVVDGYVGWLRSKFIDRDCTSIMEEKYTDRAVITGKTKKVYSSAGGGVTLKDVVMGTELFIKGKKDRYYEVALPGGLTGWIDTKDTIKVPSGSLIPATSAQDFLATVGKFIGTPYLWGGVSSWEGVDCSGLVYICSRINGVDLPRDADMQFEFIKTGVGSMEELKVGDLLFFSSNNELKDISHVGVYAGEGKFVQAAKSKGMVVESDLNTEYYIKRLKGIKRIFE
ncbi:C40 family peptidase [Acetivibrio straminisolvens]|uniref:Lipoprotein n=1 Tax=Acetivibrio straminisolvens JCM 21531 TaxID=1294263 RepID=W4V5T8_9FIRM|nr:NlpC/P60 family protein [Acetivibrio straminisolvens]GAE88546.1 lipoprotein [Acetivibrio straminisolvens JCM 21531]